MKPTVFYKQELRSTEQKQLVIITILLGLAQWLALPLRIFVRRGLGERYFTFVGVNGHPGWTLVRAF